MQIHPLSHDRLSQATESQELTSLSKISPTLLRDLFLHHDGIVIGATLYALNQQGLLESLFEQRQLSATQLLDAFPGNAGYLDVALRCLALQGWIKRHQKGSSGETIYQVTPLGDKVYPLFGLYHEVAAFIYSGVALADYLFHDRPPDGPSFQHYVAFVDRRQRKWDLPSADNGTQDALFDITRAHLDGLLVGPLMIAAKLHGLLEQASFPLDKIPKTNENILIGIKLMAQLGWIDKDSLMFTDTGRLACQFSLHYGLTLSYSPMFCRLPQLIFNATQNVTHVQPGKEEHHVDRTLNVLASGVAHRPYFEDTDKIIIEIFNQEPLEQQPRFVADMGCGDGAWLERIYHVVKSRTLRGKALSRIPLMMVGADYNLRAREVVHARLDHGGVPHLVLFGDIGDPKQFSDALAAHDIDMRDGLHIRAFIDHNRPYTTPLDKAQAAKRQPLSTGAYADQQGLPIANNALEQNLVEHFRKWAPYIEKHGLINIEAHNVAPEIAAKYNGKTHATAFDTYHGFSNQYPIDFNAYMQLAEEAGLRSVIYEQTVYPSRLPFVAISLNHFKASLDCLPISLKTIAKPLSGEWQPDGSEDIEDGEALHHFLYQNGEIDRPRRWCFYASGILVGSVIHEIEARLEYLKNDQRGDRKLTLVDYGAGTGLATLELIKGLAQKDLLTQFDRHDIDFRLVLFDFPSGWFAKAHQLLRHYPFVHYYSLFDNDENKIRVISDVLAQQTVDILYASMVLHLVPPKAMPVMFSSFAHVMKKGGLFVWNTPDTAPAPPNSIVVHAANRALRKRFLAILNNPVILKDLISKLPEKDQAAYADWVQSLETLRSDLSPEQLDAAAALARKQVLPEPTDVDHIKSHLEKEFSGKITTAMSVLSTEDAFDIALLPANQRILSEIQDVAFREKLIRFLLKYDVVPNFHSGPASNTMGFNLHWTLGHHRNRH